jgi:hypothetical protein
VVSTVVPVPVAALPVVLAVLAVAEVELFVELELELEVEPEGCKICCTRATSWLLVRVKASPLAIAAMPLAKLVSAVPMTLISALFAAVAWLSA